MTRPCRSLVWSEQSVGPVRTADGRLRRFVASSGSATADPETVALGLVVPGVVSRSEIDDAGPVRRLVFILLCLVIVSPSYAFASSGDRWKTLRARSGGVSIAVPGSWVDFSRVTPQLLDRAKAIPGLRVYIDALRKSPGTFALLVLDVGPSTVSSGFANNLNVTQTPAIGDLQLQRQVSITQLKASGLLAGIVKSSYVTLPSGRALEFRYSIRVNTRVVAETQFMLIKGKTTTVLTYTARPGTLSTATIERSARSLTLR
jgi:hypothetical protein